MRKEAILKKLNVVNRDDGEQFTVKHRLNRIGKLLSDSPYGYVDEDDLFIIYSKVPIDEIDGEIIVVTSHVDVHKDITMCYSEIEGKLLHGTYDNSITNAAIVSLMMDDRLPDNIIVAFTGDEEVEEGGAITLIEHLNRMDIEYRAVVLDVTDEGIADTTFSIENNFWGEEFKRKVIFSSDQTNHKFMFVPFDEEELPGYVVNGIASENRSEEDESWTFNQYGIECCSICIPTYGEMHDDSGLYVEKWVYEAYIEELARILNDISGDEILEAESVISGRFGMIDDIFDEDDLETGSENFYAYSKEGELILCSKLFEFDAEGSHYLVYTDNTRDENGCLKAIAGRVIEREDGEFGMEAVNDSRVWDTIEKILESLQQGE